jgi:CRP/FNR family transcriptional regulator, cyclic AMP receptor protein
MDTLQAPREQPTSHSTVSLLSCVPNLAEDLGAAERELARHVTLPARRLPVATLQLAGMLGREQSFAMLVCRGLIIHRTSFGERLTTRVLGDGDIVTAGDSYLSSEHADEYVVAGESAQVALLGAQIVQATRQIPGLLRALQLRMGMQHHRLLIQMAICQLPRVEDRVLAILWLLAETWGRVSPEGVLLPIDLTHQALGELIGARRPTVTLAISQLTRRGAAERTSAGWMLHDAPPPGIVRPDGRSGARLVHPDPRWAMPPAAPASVANRQPRLPVELLAATVDTLRVDHSMSRAQTEHQVSHARELRRRSRLLRADLARVRSVG